MIVRHRVATLLPILSSLVSLGSLVVPPAERRERIGRVTKEVRRWDNINKILAQLLPSVVNRLPGSLCSSVSDDEPINRPVPPLNLRSSVPFPVLSSRFRSTSLSSHNRRNEVTVGSGVTEVERQRVKKEPTRRVRT